MRIYLPIVAIVLALAIVNCKPVLELSKAYEECGQELGPPNGSMTGLLNTDDPKNKCFYACVMKRTGAIVDGKLVINEKALEESAKHLPDDILPYSDKKYMIECANRANENKDECERAGAFKKCLLVRPIKTNFFCDIVKYPADPISFIGSLFCKSK